MKQGARVVHHDGLEMQPPGKAAALLVSLQGCFSGALKGNRDLALCMFAGCFFGP